MKRLEMNIVDCRECPYCGYHIAQINSCIYRCEKTGATLREMGDKPWLHIGMVITPPDDCPLPDCPLDEYEPRDGDQIDRFFHLTRKSEREKESDE